MNDTILLLLGTFIICACFEKRLLHHRFALKLLLKFGSTPWGLLLAFTIATFVLSMWMSNSACTVMMCPLVETMLESQRATVLEQFPTPSHPAGAVLRKDDAEQYLEHQDEDHVAMQLLHGHPVPHESQHVLHHEEHEHEAPVETLDRTDVILPEVHVVIPHQHDHLPSHRSKVDGTEREVHFELPGPYGRVTHQRVMRRKHVVKLNRFRSAVLLCIAYSSSVGGLFTLIGSPSNLVIVSSMKTLFPTAPPVSFVNWMGYTAPQCIIAVAALYLFFVVTRCPRKLEVQTAPLQRSYDALPPISVADWIVLVDLLAMVVLWVVQSFDLLPANVQPGTIAILCAVVLFLVPRDRSCAALLTWHDMKDLNWGVILLIGGGFALSGGLRSSGLMHVIAGSISQMSTATSPFVLMLVSCAIVLLVTQVMPNTATATLMYPLLAMTAVAAGVHPYALVLPAAVVCSCAFTLPASTPPNAIVIATGYVKIGYMFRVGIVASVFMVLVACAATYGWAPALFAMDIGTLPVWARVA
eukprot:TRINITY_DN3585_c0_g1_i1.p1 TRINITY_DN3585_c0_g1~~TRINITY_DN3585_c0_g1_i1.p1  ORF type:complete len:527 (-),score=124.07 TRINITY_DN3585_c0_g1_i1:280-1860(-)